MNFERVGENLPAAAAMMRFAAFLTGDIPFEIMNSFLPELEQVELRGVACSEIDIATILKVLSCYSLISVIEDRKVFLVHKLVQEVVRESLTTTMREKVIEKVVRVLESAAVNKSDSHFIFIFRNYFRVTLICWKKHSKEFENTTKDLENCIKEWDNISKEWDNTSKEWENIKKGLENAMKERKNSSKELENALKLMENATKGLENIIEGFGEN